MVKSIFRMFADGIGYVRMTKLLREQNVLNPQAYFNQNNPDYYKTSHYWRKPFDWHATSIRAILNNPVYLGKLVFGRSKTKGFFDKRRVHTEESEWVVAENTHEPLITQEQWDTVHQMMKVRRRENGTGTVQPFAGLVKCADCGSSLNLSYTDLRELTPYVLNELIEKIVVHEKVIGPDGVKTQQVDIYYKFIGLISQKAEGGCSGEVTRAPRPREGRSA